MENLKYIIESLLFVAEDPLTIEKLRGILEIVEAKEIRETLQTLSQEYDERGGGFLLSEVAGGWQIRSRPEYHEWIKKMLQPSPQRLSKAALETLAIIAYKQPIIRADIEFIRGVDCGGVLRQLMERKLIRVLGRKEIAGRPLIYATTKLFLEMFDLKSLKDLPSPTELAEFGANLDIPVTEEAPQDNAIFNQQAKEGIDIPDPQNEIQTDQEGDIDGETISPPAEQGPVEGEPAENGPAENGIDQSDKKELPGHVEDDKHEEDGAIVESQTLLHSDKGSGTPDESVNSSQNDKSEEPKNSLT